MNDTVEPAHTVPRELLVAYHNAPTELVLVLAGVTTDNGTLGLYNGIMARERDAWLLQMLGILPNWWRLIATVHAVNLSTIRDQVGNPEQAAQEQLDGLPHRDRAEMGIGWRVIQTSGGGRIYRLPERLRVKLDENEPLIRGSHAAQFMVLVERIASSAPVLGAYEEF